MKIAIINQEASLGAWGYIYNLIMNMKSIEPDLDITFFYKNLNEKNSEVYLKNLDSKGIKLKYMGYYDKGFQIKRFSKINPKINFLDRICNNLIKKCFKLKNKKMAKQLNVFDAVFYPWPFFIEPYETSVPMFFIPHDFVFTHFFGSHFGNTYTRELWQIQKEELAKFLKLGTPIVSTPYIAEELRQTFPAYEKDINIVYVPTLGTYKFSQKTEIKEVLKKYEINNDYILYANNHSLHKNMPSVIGAYYLVKQKYPHIKLIITGAQTDGIYCKCRFPYYLDHVEYNEDYDVKSIGVIPEDDFSAVLQGAKVVVNCSLCEAGSGSVQADAWNAGVPTAISSIPPFKEAVEFLKTKTEFFDPKNSTDMADAILRLLDNPEIAKENATISKEAMSKYTWKDAAKEYLKIFRG
ncbi:MAG: glycosyltransferase [Firmicutes bacterium]|nr:glycosyltransferase [Bacillota bacterium]